MSCGKCNKKRINEKIFEKSDFWNKKISNGKKIKKKNKKGPKNSDRKHFLSLFLMFQYLARIS